MRRSAPEATWSKYEISWLIVLAISAHAVLAIGMPQAGAGAEGSPSSVPGLERYGTGVSGGRGGKVVKVTSLSGSGFGSLREAIKESEKPTTIVFEVGGVIDLQGKKLVIDTPGLTIAGQTAPPPGITIIRGSIECKANNILLQHLAIRPGDRGPTAEELQKKELNLDTGGGAEDGPLGGGGPDPGDEMLAEQKEKKFFKVHALSIRGSNVIIDHCSLSWSPFMLVNLVGKELVFSHCLFAESLILAGADVDGKQWGEGESMAVFGYESEATFLHCLWASNGQRQPMFTVGEMTVINNYIYNPGRSAIRMHKPKYTALLNTVMQAGPETPEGLHCLSAAHGTVYASGCKTISADGKELPVTNHKREKIEEFPADKKPDHLVPTDKLRPYLLKNAGMRPSQRDGVDARIIKTIREKKGKILKSQKAVGGYPEYKKTTRKLQLPDNPSADRDGNGYTNLEEWLHKLSARVEKHQGEDEKAE